MGNKCSGMVGGEGEGNCPTTSSHLSCSDRWAVKPSLIGFGSWTLEQGQILSLKLHSVFKWLSMARSPTVR